MMIHNSLFSFPEYVEFLFSFSETQLVRVMIPPPIRKAPNASWRISIT